MANMTGVGLEIFNADKGECDLLFGQAEHKVLDPEARKVYAYLARKVYAYQI
ncbi:hypothetical protein T12_444 [Trichinella patagoniensis]|uniref:Uncharacterized protein n=1 Tax=Trichinella patagoniensis TaxID=990121 RepID=A0A0V0ZYW0_9BILA|nr:hypothetical protein T12_444 [Trichinella patagoniensis]